MIVYGVKSTLLTQETMTEKCQSCNTENKVNMGVYQKYTHVFWIPFFPINKTGISECMHCKQVLNLKEMPGSYRNFYETIKLQKRTPLWTFSGLLLLVLLITWAVYANQQGKEKNTQLLATTQKGDIYQISKGYKQYTLYKVNRVAGDTVFVFMSEYETNKSSGLDDIKKKGESAFIPVEIPMMKKELGTMVENGELREIER